MASSDGTNENLRVSDAERDAVVSELGEHFQDGRLDQAEFDERLTAAMAARTQTDLDKLFTDLPRPSPADQAAGAGSGQAGGSQRWQAAAAPVRGGGWPRGLAVLPLVFAAVLIGSVLVGGWHFGGHAGWHHGWRFWPFAPFGFLWVIVPIIAVRAWLRGARRRQWR